MSEAKHTEGKWILGKHDTTAGRIDVGIRQKNGTFCPIAEVLCYEPDDVSYDEQMANARLISASPILLQACEYGLNLILNGVGQHSHAIALFEAAIALAEKEG